MLVNLGRSWRIVEFTTLSHGLPCQNHSEKQSKNNDLTLTFSCIQVFFFYLAMILDLRAISSRNAPPKLTSRPTFKTRVQRALSFRDTLETGSERSVSARIDHEIDGNRSKSPGFRGRSAQVRHLPRPAGPAAVPCAAGARTARAARRAPAATERGVGPGIHVPHLPGAPGPGAVGLGAVFLGLLCRFLAPSTQIPLIFFEFGSISTVRPWFWTRFVVPDRSLILPEYLLVYDRPTVTDTYSSRWQACGVPYRWP